MRDDADEVLGTHGLSVRHLADVPAERHAELVEVLLAAFSGAARRRGARPDTPP